MVPLNVSENNKFMVWDVLWTMPKRKNCRRAMFTYKINNSTIFVSNEKTCGRHNQPILSWRTTRSIEIQRVTLQTFGPPLLLQSFADVVRRQQTYKLKARNA
ncbi:hypothetical protein LXL04_003528 [Taraxacum kok-saghyz]